MSDYTVRRYKKGGDSYTLGTTLTIELLKKRPQAVIIVYLHSSLSGDGGEEIVKLCKSNSIPFETNNKVFNLLSQKENCYAIGVFKPFSCKLDHTQDHMVLVNPSNTGNLGTIMRSMCGFGIKNLAIISPAVDAFDPKTVRSSMGAIFDINLVYYDTFEDYIKETEDRSLYPFMLQAKYSLSDFKFTHPASLIMGNESSGLPRNFLEVGTPIIIKHSNEIDSLNITIAASIGLYELSKDRFNK